MFTSSVITSTPALFGLLKPTMTAAVTMKTATKKTTTLKTTGDDPT
ncbi:hypothetical protein ACTL6U_13360 [Rhodovibrionaceae bacterium A322]